MKQIYLTFDIEPIVSRLSFTPNIHTNVILGTFYLAKELSRRKIKATFFVSLSPKTDHIDTATYLDNVKFLLRLLAPLEHIRLQPHLHMRNLPLSYPTPTDAFSDYTQDQQVEALEWAREIFRSCGIETVDSFRPGGYQTNTQYYEALECAGYRASSVMLENGIHYDMIRRQPLPDGPGIHNIGNVTEYPVTTLRVRSIKGKEEALNLSPDFFHYDSVANFMSESAYLNINFHSFSVFTNRLARENHPGQLWYNLKYFFIEKPMIRLLRHFRIETIDHRTIFKDSFDTWLVFLENHRQHCRFVGE
jgi:hypothetical protein